MELNCICGIYEFLIDGDSWKDFIIPFISPIIGIGGAFWVVKVQIDQGKRIEQEKRNSLLYGYKKILISNVPKIVSSLEERIGTLKESSKKFKLGSDTILSKEVYQFGSAQLVSDIPYIDCVEAISTDDDYKRNAYSEFYFSIRTVKSQNDDYIKFLENSIVELNIHTNQFNALFTKTFVQYQKIIFHEKNKEALLYYRQSVIDQIAQAEDDIYYIRGNYISELEHFYYYIQTCEVPDQHFRVNLALRALVLVFRRPAFLPLISIELAQDINSLIALIDVKENTMAVMRSTSNTYVKYFQSALEKTKKLSEIIEK